MKLKRKFLAVALVLFTVATIFSSCGRKTCPAYSNSQAQTVQNNG